MKGIILALLAATAALVAAACGNNGGDGGATPGATAPAGASPTRGPVASARLCRMGGEPPASYNVQITARWKGKDRIVIEGSATLPGAGTVNYWICQDGEVTPSLVWVGRPTFQDGKISAESKLAESAVGPTFNPDASFVVVLQVLGESVQVPYFTVQIPVEGKPE